jgi:hypothetical protein
VENFPFAKESRSDDMAHYVAFWGLLLSSISGIIQATRCYAFKDFIYYAQLTYARNITINI